MRRFVSLFLAGVLAIAWLPAIAASVSSKYTVDVVASRLACSGGAGAPSICVDKTAVYAGDTLTITYDPSPYASTGSDSLVWFYDGGARWLNWASFSFPPGAGANGPGTYQWTVPGEPNEYPTPIVIEYYVAATIPNSANCVNGTCIAAISVPVTIAPTVTLPPLTATPPADVTANPPGWPGSPNKVITVCQSGCDFTTPSLGVGAAGGVDFTQVTIKAGTYDDCLNPPGTAISAPPHLWVKGVGGGLAHLRATPGCNSDAAIQANVSQLIIDNVELSDFNSGNFAGLRTFCGNNVILRNVYFHDGGMGILTGVDNCQSDFTILNSHFARAGGSVGPSHLAYFNDKGSGTTIPNDHLTVKRSVFEMALLGHLLKTHDNVNTIDCNVLLESYASIHNGSLALDFAGGGGQSTVTNNLIGQGPYFFGTNNNEGIVDFGLDLSGWSGDQPTQFLVFTGNTIINDLVGASDTISNSKTGFFVSLGRPMTPSSALPYTWSNNTWVGPFGAGGTSPLFVASFATGGDVTNVNLDSSNNFYPTRAAAGLGSITPGAYYNWPYDSSKFPMPSACSGQPIGNVAVP